MSALYAKLLAMLLLLLLGQMMQQRLHLPESFFDGANSLLIRITLPAMILASMDTPFSYDRLKTSLHLLLIVSVAFASVILTLELWRSRSCTTSKALGLYQYLILVGNTAFMGYPIIEAIYGDEGVFYASVCNLIHNLITFSYAVSLLTRGADTESPRRTASACLIATFAGISLFLLPVQLPAALHQALDWVGSITIPLCLLCTGARLNSSTILHAIRSGPVWAVSLTRLLLFPIILAPVLLLLNFRGMMIVIPTVLFATPAALTAGTFAQQYGCDADFAASTVMLSNLLALLTLPLLVVLLHP
ncbi:MAG TPA: AEC family transporter [Candidatus Agathobaculum merdavium]|nr:AEC family transporter [Candidatus Agathobaculum merdavium]